MGKHIRLTALLLAVSLLLNTAALPVTAEGSVAFTLASGEESVPTTEPTVSAIETTAPSTEATEETNASAADATEESTAPTSERSAPTEETGEPVLATGTVVCDTSVDIRKGPGTDFEAIDTAIDGQEVEIFEFYTAEGTEDTEDTENTEWARIGMDRWICLTFVLLDEEEPTEAAEPSAPTEEIEETALATGIVVCNTCVNIRKGPGTGFEVVDVAYNGQEVEIFEFCTIEGTENTEWGRIGVDRWICLTYVILNGQAPTDPTEESSEATDPTEESTEVTDPTEESTESTDPTEESSEASDPTEESSEATDPTEESSEATDPTEESSEATDPTEESSETTEPTEENPGTMPVSGTSVSALNLDDVRNRVPEPQKMSLYWWAVVCGKIKDTSTTALVSPSLPEDDSGEEETTEDTTAPSEETEATEPASDPTEQTDTTVPPATEESTAPTVAETTAPTNEESIAAAVKETTSPAIDETIAPPLEKITVPVSGDEEVPGDYFVAPFVGPLVLDGENGKEEDNSGNVVAFGIADDPPYNGPIDINNPRDLICLSYVDPSQYKDKKLSFANLSGGTDFNLTAGDDGKVTVENYVLHYQGLGNDANPFQGQFVVDSGSSGLKLILDKPLFTALSDHATIYVSASTEGGPVSGVNLVSAATPSATFAALLADKVYRSGSPAEPHWTVAIQTQSPEIAAPSILGTMQEGSSASLNVTAGSTFTVSGSGYLCAVMEQNASLTVSGVSSVPVVNNPTASAATGGLVGKMDNNAKLTVEGDGLVLGSVTATEEGNAGGLVGEATDPVLIIPTISGSATITGKDAGGLIGSMTVTPGAEGTTFRLWELQESQEGQESQEPQEGQEGQESQEQQAADQNFEINGLTVNGKFSSGGLFGLLRNNGGSYTIKNITSNVTFGGGGEKAGGLIGSYAASALTDTLKIEGNTTSSTLSGGVGNYGGLIGYVYNAPAYIVISGTVNTTENATPTNYGGLISTLDNQGHMLSIGEVHLTPKTNNEAKISGSTAVGGLIGTMPGGVVYLSAAPTFENSPSHGGSNAAKRGWILGERGNTLVYTDVDWPSREPNANNTNDTGVWGQVLRVGQGSKLDGLLSSIDAAEHTVTVCAVSTETLTDAEGTKSQAFSINDEKDFAALALRMQLNDKNGVNYIGALRFSGSDLAANEAITVSFAQSIDLNDTGLTGFTRDVSTGDSFPITILGNQKSVTLPSIKVYVANESHNRQGLIGLTSDLSIQDLTVNTVGRLLTDSEEAGYRVHILEGDPYIGMVVAEIKTGGASPVKLKNVKSSVKLVTSSGNQTKAKISGIIAAVADGNKNIEFTECTWDGSIYDTCGGNTYCGGFMSMIVDERDDSRSRTITVKKCYVFGSINKVANITGTKYVPVGAFICTLYYGTTTLEVDDLTVTGVNVTVTGTANSCGGLLSYEWVKTNATVKNVKITGCKLSTPNSCEFGGLVYKASGRCQLGDDQGTPGITFVSGNTITGYSSDGSPSGLLFCRGDKIKDALYLVVKQGGYIINHDEETSKDAVEVTLQNGYKYFDELVGRTKSSSGNGIVSISTPAGTDGKRRIDLSSCNTYKPQLSTQYDNDKTRYYYNLDEFFSDVTSASSSTSTIDTPEKMVLMSAGLHCDSTLKKYFFTNGGNATPTKITSDLDLTGCSYYPVPNNGSIAIENATITFDYEGLETVEGSGISLAGGGTKENKKPSNSLRQHYQMHTGIFTDAINSAESGHLTLTVSGLTLKGTVGGSAIINGTAKGNASAAMTKLQITGVTLDGIRIYRQDGTLLPLLINSIQSYTSLAMTDVTTTGTYQTLESFTHAATSLIGKVGETNTNKEQVGKNIQLNFSLMALDGRINADAKNTLVHNTTRSIFKEALFLQEFQYTDNKSWGIYNFTESGKVEGDDYYTLGRELSNAEGAENVRNGGEQFYFYGTSDYVYCAVGNLPNSEGSNAGAAAYFTDATYRRYVGNKEATPSSTCHEMDINLRSRDIIKGCGTYSDPYIIEHGKQLMAVANVLNGVEPKINWKLTLNTTILSNGLSSQDGHLARGSTQDKEYTWDGTIWYADADNTTDNPKVIEYLRNAYYQLKCTDENERSINLTSEWGGLGSYSHPFRGVILGADDITVHIRVTDATQFGGLITFSEGSVVKNVKIHYDHAPTINCGAAPSSSDAPFFGGVVGWCIGGDTIVDGVTVTYSAGAAPTITGGKAYLVPVGGYVGLVGGTEGLNGTTDGLGGGVVFRNISGSNLPNVSIGGKTVTPSADTNYFYVNPYVGRVLDGYAITEGSGFINTDKNYTIPSLTGPGLALDNGKIVISNNEGLWLLSAVVNSGAGSVGTVRAYSSGKARACDYGSVGQTMPAGEEADEAIGAAPYLIRKFNLDNGFKTITAGRAFPIELTGNCDMTNYGNGFRGIGGSYGTIGSENRLLKVSSISSSSGSKFTITLQQDRKEYADESQAWTTLGAGLFTVLNPATEFTAERLTLAGDTGITYYSSALVETVNPTPGNAKLMDVVTTENNVNYSYRLGCSGAGLLAGTMTRKQANVSKITLTGIDLTGKVTGSATFAGGLIGLACINSNKTYYIDQFNVTDCWYHSLKVTGHASVGGFLGYVNANKLTIKATSAVTLSDLTVESESVALTGALTGVGGLIGRCDADTLFIGGDTDQKMTFSQKLTVTNGDSGDTPDKAFTGGLAGLLGMRSSGNATIQNITVQGAVSISNPGRALNSSGALAGALSYYGRDLYSNTDFDWGKANNVTVNVSNVEIAPNQSDSVTIKNTKQGGVLLGFLMASVAAIKNCDLGSDNSKVTIATETASNSASLGGLIGTLSAANPLTLSDICLNHVNVWGRPNDGNRGAALLVGYTDNSAVCKIYNVKMKDCNVAVSRDDARAGFLYGDYSGNSVSGFNILIENCTVGLSLGTDNKLTYFTAESGDPARIGLKNGNTYKTYEAMTAEECGTYTSNNIGIFGGKATNKDVKLVGVSLQGCFTPRKDFGETSSSGTKYAIRADYAGAAQGTASDVTIKPDMVFPGIGTLTSDGIAFAEDSSTPLAQKIVADYLDGSVRKNRVHFNVDEDVMTELNESGCISTYNTASESEPLENDFPVLVINSIVADEITEQVSNYIAMMTNEPISAVVPSDITATTYKWSNNSFVQQGDATLTVSIIKSNNINVGISVAVNKGRYDNQLNQFTLLDVQYDDPTGSGKVYHLYIPVIVKKVLEFKFWASAEVGTSYWTGAYNSDTQAVSSHGDQVTVLLTYEYCNRKDGDWQNAVDNGENLLWNFEKSIILENNQGDAVCLPGGTRLTLVDRNSQNLAYYWELSNNISGKNPSLEFKSFDRFKEAPLCDILKLTADPNTAGKHVAVGNESEATLKVNGAYYRPATTEELKDTSKLYLIKVGDYNKGTEGYLQEQYYLTILTPADSTAFVNLNLIHGKHLTAPEGILGPPTHWNKATVEGNGYALRGSENMIVLGNFFKHILSVTTSSSLDQRMSSTNNSIIGELTATLSIKEEDKADFRKFKTYASNKSLYQCFNLYLKEHESSGSEFRKNFASGAQLSVTYYENGVVAGSETLLGFTGSEAYCQLNFPYGFAVSSLGDNMNLELKAEFTLTYTDAGLIDQFPQKQTATEDVGIRVCGSSSLAYAQDALEQSILRKDEQDGRLFYREEVNLAELNYNAYDLANPTQASGLSQLGINGLDGTSFGINSAASYDVSALEGASSATGLRCKLELLRKNDDGTYPTDATLALDTYLKNVTLDATINGNSSASTMTKQSDGTYSLALNGLDKDVPIQFEVNFNVLTGSVFEEISGATYANYKVRLTAWLVNDNNEIGGSSANDYIIYTNAKILTSLVS